MEASSLFTWLFLLLIFGPMVARFLKQRFNPDEGTLKRYHAGTAFKRRPQVPMDSTEDEEDDAEEVVEPIVDRATKDKNEKKAETPAALLAEEKVSKGAKTEPVASEPKADESEPAAHPQVRERPWKVSKGAKKTPLPAVFLRFGGDTSDAALRSFGEQVDEVVFNRGRINEAIVQVSSPGGAVTDYGQLYAQMKRISDAGVYLTVAVDRYAASGGYLMSLPADRIVAEPMAIVGSIGVVASVPNVREALERIGIKPRTFTAGEHKRTVHFTDEDTDEVREEFQKQLKAIHDEFKRLVALHREGVDLAKVADGSHWTAKESMDLDLKLVDEIMTPSELLMQVNSEREVIELTAKSHKSMVQKLFADAALGIGDAARVWLRKSA